MRVITQDTTGGPEVLQLREHEIPEPGEGEILVRIAAAGVNPVDLKVRSGAVPLLGDPPFILGWDIAGTVEKAGLATQKFRQGDRVFGMPRFPKQAGAYAEYAAVPENEMILAPEGITDVEAAALPLAGLTAWQALAGIGKIKPGQRVLIHAGAGGVGHLAIQIARYFGAHVTTTVSIGKIAYVESIGVETAIDYQAGDFTRFVHNADFVLDPIGGEHVARSIEATAAGGAIVCLRAPSPEAIALAQEKNVRLETILVHPDAEGLAALVSLIADGFLKVHVAQTFPLERADDAHDFMGTCPIGKVVLEV
jgi:NADPH:quinone reductase-like Zn-dependent oxidoreductase